MMGFTFLIIFKLGVIAIPCSVFYRFIFFRLVSFIMECRYIGIVLHPSNLFFADDQKWYDYRLTRKLHWIRKPDHSIPVTLLLHFHPVNWMWYTAWGRSHAAASHLFCSQPPLCACRVLSDTFILVVLLPHGYPFFFPLQHVFNIWDGTGCLKLGTYQFVFLRRHRCPNMESPRALNVLIAQSAQHSIYVYIIIII